MNRDLALWTGVLTGPSVWLISLEAEFVLAPWICTFHWKPAVLLVSFLAAAITFGAGTLSWRCLREWNNAASEAEQERHRAMAMAGVVLSGAFLIVLFAQAIPQFMLAGCE